MKRNLLILSGLVALTLFSGCIVRGTVRARAYGPQPDLVMISPGVYVVADYDDSVFYYDNYYWRYDGYVWYRSNVYTGGWARWSSPPRAIVRIDRPRAYVRYRGNGNVHHQPARPVGRDHRAPNRVQPAPRSRPAARDH
ncbi:MAG: hypothetical protein KC464_03585, partial [Myxococcales bacterium]|nr:hypothetical protein [Myxococcales bacterium]